MAFKIKKAFKAFGGVAKNVFKGMAPFRVFGKSKRPKGEYGAVIDQTPVDVKRGAGEGVVAFKSKRYAQGVE